MRITPHVDVFLTCLWGEVSSMSSYSAILISLLAFTFLNGWKIFSKNNILRHEKIIRNSNFSVHRSIFMGTQPHRFVFILSMAAFILQRWTWVPAKQIVDGMWHRSPCTTLVHYKLQWHNYNLIESRVLSVLSHHGILLFFISSRYPSCQNKRKVNFECCVFKAQ